MKKELIEKIMKDLPAGATTWEIEESLKKNLPDFQRIDWERLRDCFGKASNGYVSSHLSVAVKEYNSTLPPALVPLPKEMPKDLTRFAMGHDVDEVWDKIISEYGTYEQKPNLPSVEELAKEMLNVWNVNTFNEVAEYVINKYSLHPREEKGFPFNLKDGESFMYNGEQKVFREGHTSFVPYHECSFSIKFCTPYTTPSAQDIISKYGLSEEEVRVIREGK